MTLHHKALVNLLRRAYSAEKAAAFAYQGHAGSVKDIVQKAAIRQIEVDEWNHRKEVLGIMTRYNINRQNIMKYVFTLSVKSFQQVVT